MNHRWFENSRNEHTTVRICERCELRKVSRHEMDGNGFMQHWTEFYRGTEKIGADKTPVCTRIEVQA